MLGLYIHIPFCKSLCSYCDFPKRINTKDEVIDAYLKKLIKDINETSKKNLIFDSIYIGGGTPNFLSNNRLIKLFNALDAIKLAQNAEFSVEGNYELYNEENLEILKNHRVNRLSIGVETLNEKQGKLINRVSNFNALKEKYKLIREKGFKNVNFDFIFGLPFETLEDVKENLSKIIELNPEHISYYSLILEDKSVLKHDLTHKNIKLPDDDLSADMYELIINTLKNNGYHHYEISNLSKPGYESVHNKLYWTYQEYIGLGLSASSFINGKRYYNSSVMDEYLSDLNVRIEESTKGEYFWLGLRLMDGISLEGFKEKFYEDPFKLYPIEELINKGLLEINNDKLRFTSKGLDNGNDVMSKFLD